MWNLTQYCNARLAESHTQILCSSSSLSMEGFQQSVFFFPFAKSTSHPFRFYFRFDFAERKRKKKKKEREEESSGNALSTPKHGWPFAFLGPHHYPLQLSLSLPFPFHNRLQYSRFCFPFFPFCFLHFLLPLPRFVNNGETNYCLLIFIVFSSWKVFDPENFFLGFSDQRKGFLIWVLFVFIFRAGGYSFLFLPRKGLVSSSFVCHLNFLRNYSFSQFGFMFGSICDWLEIMEMD